MGVDARIGRWAARLVAGVCMAVSGFQVALALGAPLGRMAWGGSSEVLPANLRAASAGAAAVLVLAAGAMLVRAGDLAPRWPALPFRILSAVLAVQLAMNTAANLAGRSPAERYGMGAVTAIGCLAALLAALAPARLSPPAAPPAAG